MLFLQLPAPVHGALVESGLRPQQPLPAGPGGGRRIGCWISTSSLFSSPLRLPLVSLQGLIGKQHRNKAFSKTKKRRVAGLSHPPTHQPLLPRPWAPCCEWPVLVFARWGHCLPDLDLFGDRGGSHSDTSPCALHSDMACCTNEFILWDIRFASVMRRASVYIFLKEFIDFFFFERGRSELMLLSSPLPHLPLWSPSLGVTGLMSDSTARTQSPAPQITPRV